MQLSQIQKIATEVTLKGKNHKQENCYYVHLGDKILDVIENVNWMLEIVMLRVSPDGKMGKNIRISLDSAVIDFYFAKP